MTRPAKRPQPTSETDSTETAFFADVDQANRNDRLLAAMDATARWPAVQELRAWTEPAITRGDSVIDVGCGLAEAAMAIAKNHPQIAVTGIDSSVEMLATARQRARELDAGIALRHGDATSLPFDTGSANQWSTTPTTSPATPRTVCSPSTNTWNCKSSEAARAPRPRDPSAVERPQPHPGCHHVDRDRYRPTPSLTDPPN